MTEDGDSCWPGLDLNVPLTLNKDQIGKAKDDHYLYNMARLENLFQAKVFEQSFLGTWGMRGNQV